MGLDNGIVIKHQFKEDELPWFVKAYELRGDECEICYWRGFMGLRREIINILDPLNKYEYHYPVQAEDIPPIIYRIESFIDADYFNDYGANTHTIEYRKEVKDMLLQDVKNLCWLKDYMEKNPTVLVYFYDSY